MKVTVKKLTSLEEAREAIATTVAKDFASKATLDQIYHWLHSPARTQIFNILFEDIPTFVSVHLVRHVTIQPFVTSKRPDRGGDGKEDRYTPVDMRIYANAEALINMARKRLCYKASPETSQAVRILRGGICEIDPDLAKYMVRECVFRGGYCPEPKPCGHFKVKIYNPEEIEKGMRK